MTKLESDGSGVHELRAAFQGVHDVGQGTAGSVCYVQDILYSQRVTDAIIEGDI